MKIKKYYNIFRPDEFYFRRMDVNTEVEIEGVKFVRVTKRSPIDYPHETLTLFLLKKDSLKPAKL